MGEGRMRGENSSSQRIVTALFSTLFCALLITPLVLGVGIGVNRAAINYQDVLQNGYAEETILITTDSPTPISGTYQLEGELAPWIRLEPANTSYAFSADKPYQVRIIVEPPSDAQLRNYEGTVRVLTGEIDRIGGGKIGQSTRAAFLIRINAGLTGTQIVDCNLGGVRIRDTEEAEPFDFLATVKNTGNVRIKPTFDIVVHDQFYTKTVLNTSVDPNEEILPTTTREFLEQVAHDLPVGQYWANVRAPLCDDSVMVEFDVVEPGGIADKGELIRVDVNPWTKTGDIIPVNAVFKNTGPRTVNAKFKGTVTKRGGDKIYKVIDTDAVSVLPGKTVNIETFFNPTEPGQYIIAGRVYYNKKITLQKSGVTNTRGPSLVEGWNLTPFFFVLLAILILLLLILIARRKKKRRPGYGRAHGTTRHQRYRR